MPVATIAGQTRGIQTQHGTHLSGAKGCDQTIEAGPFGGATCRSSKIIVDDLDVDEAATMGDLDQLVLSPLTFRVRRFCRCDVGEDGEVARLVAFALSTFGDLDIVVNNAGTTHRNQPLLDVSEAEFERIYRVNVKSLFLSAKHAVPHFRRKRGGVFITIASTAGVRPRPGLTWYNGSKGAAIVTSRSMAAELARDNIRVNVINPVAGETAMLAEFMGEDTPEKRAQFVSTIPLGRLSQPSDVATAAVFFASDEAAFITGACLEVDGGRCV
jgi:3-oxoacyl-[acyl-carrier protein] reductase